MLDMSQIRELHLSADIFKKMAKLRLLKFYSPFNGRSCKMHLPTGLVGLSLAYALTLKEAQVFWSRMFSMSSNHIISVERIMQFIEIPAEPPAIVEDNRPPSSWPSKGRIDLRALEVRRLINSLCLWILFW